MGLPPRTAEVQTALHPGDPTVPRMLVDPCAARPRARAKIRGASRDPQTVPRSISRPLARHHRLRPDQPRGQPHRTGFHGLAGGEDLRVGAQRGGMRAGHAEGVCRSGETRHERAGVPLRPSDHRARGRFRRRPGLRWSQDPGRGARDRWRIALRLPDVRQRRGAGEYLSRRGIRRCLRGRPARMVPGQRRPESGLLPDRSGRTPAQPVPGPELAFHPELHRAPGVLGDRRSRCARGPRLGNDAHQSR